MWNVNESAAATQEQEDLPALPVSSGAAASGYFWPSTVVGDHYFSLSLVILLLGKFPSNNLI